MAGGAPKGNTNATKTRVWAEAIDKVLKQSDDGKHAELRKLAEKLVEMAIAGDMQAMKEIGDRVDGKSLASIELTGSLQISDMTDAQLDKRLNELNESSAED